MNDNLLPAGGSEGWLAGLERQFQLVRDHVTAVVKGFKTGLFLYGPGGIGKSHTVLRRLEDLQATYHLFNSRMTAKGLFLVLKHAPDTIHVLEDMERLTKDADAQGVLRMLCGRSRDASDSSPGQPPLKACSDSPSPAA